jgi:hypothetical protein
MTDARLPSRERDASGGQGPGAGTMLRGGRRPFGETETRPGILTTEFLVTVLAAATVVIAGYVSDVFAEDLAWSLFAGIVAAYIVSRGIAKAGAREDVTGRRDQVLD